jgi:hypothetical protein
MGKRGANKIIVPHSLEYFIMKTEFLKYKLGNLPYFQICTFKTGLKINFPG